MDDDGGGLEFTLQHNGNGNGAGPGHGPLDEITAITDPWEYKNRVLNTINLQDRAPYLDRFTDLVRPRPPAERDALAEAGREVWRYKMDTFRNTLRQLDEVTEGVSRTAVMVATDDLLAETVYRPGDEKEIGYMVHDFNAPEVPPRWVESLEVGKSVYYPPGTTLLATGTILFPTDVEEYGTDWDLFLHIRGTITRYLQLEGSQFRTLMVCYILMTWLYDRFDALPYLRAQGDLGSGKSRLLQVVGSMCYRPTMAGGALSESPIFRIIDKFRGTLVIDEADFGKSDLWDGIVKVLNTGYQRGFPVLRTERVQGQAEFDVRAYDCYGPKLLATRRRFADAALESRCLSYTMPLLTELKADMPLVLGPEFRADVLRVRNMLLLWRFRRYNKVTVDSRARVPGMEPRVNQIIQPLLACTDDQRLKNAIIAMVHEYSKSVQAERRESLEGVVLGSLISAWFRANRPERVALKRVTEVLRVDHELANITDRKVGDVVRRVLGVPMDSRGGVAHVLPTLPNLHRLAVRYGLDLTGYGATLGELTTPLPALPPAPCAPQGGPAL